MRIRRHRQRLSAEESKVLAEGVAEIVVTALRSGFAAGADTAESREGQSMQKPTRRRAGPRSKRRAWGQDAQQIEEVA